MIKFFVTSGVWLSACILSAHSLSVFSFSALPCAATGAAETVTGTLSFCYLLFIWKCLLLSVCGDWLSIAVCSSVHIYMNGCSCWYFLLGMRRQTHIHNADPLFFFLTLKSTFGQYMYTSNLFATLLLQVRIFDMLLLPNFTDFLSQKLKVVTKTLRVTCNHYF